MALPNTGKPKEVGSQTLDPSSCSILATSCSFSGRDWDRAVGAARPSAVQATNLPHGGSAWATRGTAKRKTLGDQDTVASKAQLH